MNEQHERLVYVIAAAVTSYAIFLLVKHVTEWTLVFLHRSGL